jgi:hypothetical protein
LFKEILEGHMVLEDLQAEILQPADIDDVADDPGEIDVVGLTSKGSSISKARRSSVGMVPGPVLFMKS